MVILYDKTNKIESSAGLSIFYLLKILGNGIGHKLSQHLKFSNLYIWVSKAMLVPNLQCCKVFFLLLSTFRQPTTTMEAILKDMPCTFIRRDHILIIPTTYLLELPELIFNGYDCTVNIYKCFLEKGRTVNDSFF